MSGFVDAGVLVVFVPLLLGALLLTHTTARALGSTRLLAALALSSLAAILAVTLGVRALDGGGFAGLSMSWLFDGGLWANSVNSGSGWWLNVVLFVPAGVFVALATRHPGRALVALITLSLLIEMIQSVGFLGAPDPADLVANSLGACVGVAAATVWMRRPNVVDSTTAPRSTVRVAMVIVAAALTVSGIGGLGLIAGADARRASLAQDLRKTFAGTTSSDIGPKIESQTGFTELLAATSVRPSYLGRVGDTNQFEGRYSIDFFGLHRCVFIRWNPNGFTLRDGSGGACTIFREKPPDS